MCGLQPIDLKVDHSSPQQSLLNLQQSTAQATLCYSDEILNYKAFISRCIIYTSSAWNSFIPDEPNIISLSSQNQKMSKNFLTCHYIASVSHNLVRHHARSCSPLTGFATSARTSCSCRSSVGLNWTDCGKSLSRQQE